MAKKYTLVRLPGQDIFKFVTKIRKINLKTKKSVKLWIPVQSKLNKKVLNFVVSSGSSFSICENLYFKDLINYSLELDRLFGINIIDAYFPPRKTIKETLKKEAINIKTKFLKKINNINYKDDLCMSIDLSIDCVNKRSYVGIILYWIEGTNNGKWRGKIFVNCL